MIKQLKKSSKGTLMPGWASKKEVLQDPNVDKMLQKQDTSHLYKKLIEKKKSEWKQDPIKYGPRPIINSKDPYIKDKKKTINNDDHNNNIKSNIDEKYSLYIDDDLDDLEKELGLNDDDDVIVRNIQEKRKNELKQQWKDKQKYASKGNAGRYEEMDEKEMLKEACKGGNIIIHFYADTIPRSEIVDKHFSILAPKHIECKFVKLNARKSPFLVKKWKIKTLPAICIIQKGYLSDKIIGFDEFGGIDEFPTKAMERRFAKAGSIKDKNGKWIKKQAKTKVLTDL